MPTSAPFVPGVACLRGGVKCMTYTPWARTGTPGRARLIAKARTISIDKATAHFKVDDARAQEHNAAHFASSSARGTTSGVAPGAPQQLGTVRVLLVLAGTLAAYIFLSMLRLTRRVVQRTLIAAALSSPNGERSLRAQVCKAVLSVLGADVHLADVSKVVSDETMQRYGHVSEQREAESSRAELEQISTLRAELDVAESRIARLQQDSEVRDQRLAALRAERDAEVDELSGAVQDATRRLQAMESGLQAAKQREASDARRLRALESEAESSRARVAELESSGAHESALLASVRDERDAILADAESASAELAEARSEIAALSQAREKALQDAEERAHALDALQSAYSALQNSARSQEADLASQLESATSEVQHLKAQLEHAEALQHIGEAGSAGGVTDAQPAEVAAVRATLKDAEQENSQLRQRLHDIMERSTKLEAEVERVASALEQAEANGVAAAERREGLSRELAAAEARAQKASEAATTWEGEALEAKRALQLRSAEADAVVAELSRKLETSSSEAAESKQRLNEVVAEVTAAVEELSACAREPASAEALGAGLAAGEGGALPEGGPAWWAAPMVELRARHEARLARVAAARDELRELFAGVPDSAAQECERLRAAVLDVEARFEGLRLMRVPEQRAEKEAELTCELSAARQALGTFLARRHSRRARARYEALTAEVEECEAEAAALASGMRKPMRQRLVELLAHNVVRLRAALSTEMEASEAQSARRIEQMRADAEADIEESRWRVEALAAEKEDEIEARARDAEAAAELRRSEVASAEASLEALRQEQATLAAERARLEAAVAELGPPALLPEREAELRAQEEQVASRVAQLHVQAAELAERAEEVEASERSVAEERSAVEALSASVSEREAEMGAARDALQRKAEELQTREDTLASGWDGAWGEGSSSRATQLAAGSAEIEEMQRQFAQQGQELAALRERYESHFSATTQQRVALEQRNRRLRRQVAARDAQLQRLGVEPASWAGEDEEDDSDGGSGAGREGPDGGPAAVRSGAPGAASGADDVSVWARQLITNLSRTAGSDGAGARASQGSAGVLHTATRPTRAREGSGATTLAPVEVTTLALAATGAPHPDKASYGGDDAYFIQDDHGGALGVADGVGGWNAAGVNVANYSRALMMQTARALKGGPNVSCLQALDAAHRKVEAPGTSTAIVARLLRDKHLEVLNLGDSGLRIVRRGDVVFATKALQHKFNMPYQLGNPNIIAETDFPRDATVSRVPVEPLDVIVMASDGLFDNVWDEEIGEVVMGHEGARSSADAQRIADALLKRCTDMAQDTTSRTPWSVAAAKGPGANFFQKMFPRGGKVDDVSIVVAIVT